MSNLISSRTRMNIIREIISTRSMSELRGHTYLLDDPQLLDDLIKCDKWRSLAIEHGTEDITNCDEVWNNLVDVVLLNESLGVSEEQIDEILSILLWAFPWATEEKVLNKTFHTSDIGWAFSTNNEDIIELVIKHHHSNMERSLLNSSNAITLNHKMLIMALLDRNVKYVRMYLDSHPIVVSDMSSILLEQINPNVNGGYTISLRPMRAIINDGYEQLIEKCGTDEQLLQMFSNKALWGFQ